MGYLNDNNTCVCLEYNESFTKHTLERCQVQMNNNLTVVVLTKNEEKNIVAVVQNAKQVAAEVLIVDSGSTDKTVQLAEENGARVVYRDWDNDFAAQRNFALQHVKTEWVLYLDADERMNDELINDIQEKISSHKAALYRFVRHNNAFGKEFHYGVLGPDSVVRLFPVGQAKWEGKVHEGLSSKLEIVTLKGHLSHYTYSSFEEYLDKMNKYSSLGAVDRNLRGKKCSVIGDLILRPLFAFFKMYILKGGFLEGWLGLVLCLNYANYTLNKYVKLKMMGEN